MSRLQWLFAVIALVGFAGCQTETTTENPPASDVNVEDGSPIAPPGSESSDAPETEGNSADPAGDAPATEPATADGGGTETTPAPESSSAEPAGDQTPTTDEPAGDGGQAGN